MTVLTNRADQLADVAFALQEVSAETHPDAATRQRLTVLDDAIAHAQSAVGSTGESDACQQAYMCAVGVREYVALHCPALVRTLGVIEHKLQHVVIGGPTHSCERFEPEVG